MELKEILIGTVLMIGCMVGFFPAVKGFKDALNYEGKALSRGLYLFTVFWLGLGVASIVFVFFVIGYSMLVKLKIMPDFSV
jgi:hypothetical protein